MWLSIGTWLVGSKAGRIAATVALSLVMAGLIVVSAFRKGETAEKARQQTATLDAIRKKVASDDEIDRLPAAARRERLRQWAR